MQHETAVTYSRALSVVEDFHIPATIRCQITDTIMRADDGEPADWHEVRTLAEKYGTRRHREDVATIIERIDLDAIRAAAARNTYEIGGTSVVMSAAAAAAWNAGDLSEDALAGAEVLLLDGARADLWSYIGGQSEWSSTAASMEGMPANWIGGGA